MRPALLISGTMKAGVRPINRCKRAHAMRTMQIGQNTRSRVNQKPAIHAISRRVRVSARGVRTMLIDDRPTIASPDDDPYLWLEEIEGERALAFVARQSKLTLERFGDAGFADDRDTLTAIYDRSDNIPFIGRRGAFVYNLWKDANNPRGLWRQTTLDEFRGSNPKWETLLDLDRLAAEENQDWILTWIQALPGSSARAMLSLSRGGSDAATLREFDIEAKTFVADGSMVPEAKSSEQWFDDDSLLLSSAYGEGMATTSGYARTVRLWRRGTDPDRAPVIFETPPDHMVAFSSVDRTDTVPRVWFTEQLDFFNHNVWLGDQSGARLKLDLPTDAHADFHGDWFAIRPRKPWTVGTQTYATDTVLGTSLPAFLAGEREFQVLCEAGPRRAVQHFFWTGGKLVISILDELRPIFEVWTPSAGGWARARLPGLPEIGVVDVWRLDTEEEDSNGDLLANIQDPLTSSALMLIEDMQNPTVLKRAPKTFFAEGLVVTRHEAISTDGERIPYVETGPAAKTGDAPVYLNAYGGFGVSVRPHYNSAVGKLGLGRGGTSVIAHISGGGEFGTRWPDRRPYAREALAPDDFAAAATDPLKS